MQGRGEKSGRRPLHAGARLRGVHEDTGYITVLGPENPPNCGQPEWEQDVRKWLQ